MSITNYAVQYCNHHSYRISVKQPPFYPGRDVVATLILVRPLYEYECERIAICAAGCRLRPLSWLTLVMASLESGDAAHPHASAWLKFWQFLIVRSDNPICYQRLCNQGANDVTHHPARFGSVPYS